ncbi:MAG: dehypoxanthine futalosine cyclase [Candidatus Sericytochromatia bacterium]|nr:dehypoxanthine futalosine cyclase [Candidatus Sericytochromatia bacterium]
MTAPLTSPVRAAAVVYLNSEPILHGLYNAPGFEVSRTVPSDCARKLLENEADVGLIPVAAYATHGLYEIVPGIAIAARGPVGSVCVFSRVPIEDVQAVALDGSSRTSAVLARLWLRHRLSTEPRLFQVDAADLTAAIDDRTAALVIGDQARTIHDDYPYVYDLAEEWQTWTGLPFVFAVWAARPGTLDANAVQVLQDSLAQGLAARGDIAQRYADAHGESKEAVERYLHDQIRYDLGPAEITGLQHFLQLAAEQGLLPACELRFVGETNDIEVSVSVDDLLAKGARGERLTVAEAIRIDQEAPLLELGMAADLRRQALHPDGDVTYIIERNINYTNVCNVYCRFCAFYRAPGHVDGYILTKEQIGEKIAELVAADGIQVLLQGGLNPELGIEYYEDLFRWIKANYPIKLHALSPDEIHHIRKVSNISLLEVLTRLRDAGMDSLPGGGAELLVDGTRKMMAGLKTKSEEWLDVMRTAHRIGMRTTCTMMFGVGEGSDVRVGHLNKLRELQDQTGGFTAFICWTFQDQNTKMTRGDTSAHAYLRTQALARLFLDNIPNIQSSWVTMGPGIGQTALYFGANDFGQIMFEENVVSAAGTTFHMDEAAMQQHIRAAGFTPMRRNMRYERLPVGV